MSFKNFIVKSYMLRRRKRWQKRLKGRMPSKEAMRKWFVNATAQFEVPEEVSIKKLEIEGIKTEWLIPPGAASDEIIYYLHGGGYFMGSIETYRALAGKMALESGTKVLLIEYALAPENPYPAALNDALNMYKWLTNNGYKSVNIMVAGDSAGAGLALSTLIEAREQGVILPAGLVLLSPWVDLACSGESYTTKAAKDPMFDPKTLPHAAKWYTNEAFPPDDPRVSPMYADLSGLPPMLIHAGTCEIFMDDAVQLAENAKKAGVDVELEVWKGQMHVFQLLWQLIPEGRKGIEKIGRFTRKKLGEARVMYHEV